MSSSKLVSALLPILVAAAVLVGLPVDREPRMALAISVWMVLAWMVESLHPAFVGLIGCFLFWASGAAGFEHAFGGFDGPLPWFLYGVLVLVAVAEDTGFSRWVGARLPRGATRSVGSAALVLLVLGYLVGLVVPSALARGVVLVVLALGVSDSVGAGPIRRRLLVVVAAYAAVLFDRAATPWSTALLVWDIAAAATCWAIVVSLAAKAERTDAPAPGPASSRSLGTVLTPDARNVALVASAAVLLWLTTPLHGISPALVGLAAGLVLYIPGIGVTPKDKTVPDPLAVVFVGTALSIPLVLAEGKAGTALAGMLASWVDTASLLPREVTTYWAAVVENLFAPDGGPESAEMSHALAERLGPLAAAALVWVAAAGTKLAIYQSPALILGFAAGRLGNRDVLRIGAALVVVGAVVALVLG